MWNRDGRDLRWNEQDWSHGLFKDNRSESKGQRWYLACNYIGDLSSYCLNKRDCLPNVEFRPLFRTARLQYHPTTRFSRFAFEDIGSFEKHSTPFMDGRQFVCFERGGGVFDGLGCNVDSGVLAVVYDFLCAC